jgi:hypothetical protein
MNYPAASYGVSIGSYHNASRGGELNLYPPQEGLSASGGLVRLRRIEYCLLKIEYLKNDSHFHTNCRFIAERSDIHQYSILNLQY